jgi:hypothetical protein
MFGYLPALFQLVSEWIRQLFSQVSSLGMRCGSTTKFQRANARVLIGNITINCNQQQKRWFFYSQQPVHKHYEDRAQQQTVLNHVGHVTNWSQQFKENAQDYCQRVFYCCTTTKTAWQLHLDVLQQTPCRPDLDTLITSFVH